MTPDRKTTRKRPDTASAIGRRRESARQERSAAWAERHDQILAAAADVLRESGFRATHVTDIAERLGVHQSNIYYYFATKEEIFFELIRQVVDDSVAKAESIARSSDAPPVKLNRIIEALADSYDRNYPLMQIYVREDIGKLGGTEASEHFVKAAGRYERAVLRVVRDGIKSGDLSSDLDPGMVVLTVLGAVNWMHRWYSPDGKASGVEVGRTISRMLLHGLMHDPPPES